MAQATKSVDREKLTEDYLSCSVCLEHFKQPKVLQCQHTFCLPCLQGLVGDRNVPRTIITCPLCREETVVESGDLNTLKTNFLVEDLLGFLSDTNAGPSSASDLPQHKIPETCQLCSAKNVVLYCDECKLWMCTTCSAPHDKIPATKSHKVMKLPEVVEVAKDRLRRYQEQLKRLKQRLEDQLQKVLINQQMMSEQAEKASGEIDMLAKKILEAVDQKKKKLQQKITHTVSCKSEEQNLHIFEVEKNAYKVQCGLDLIKNMLGSSDINFVNQIDRVEEVRRSILGLEDRSKTVQHLEFQSSGWILETLNRAELGNLNVLSKEKKPVPDYPRVGNIEAKVLGKVSKFISGLVKLSIHDCLFITSGNVSLFKTSPSAYGPGRLEIESEVKVLCPWNLARFDNKHLLVSSCKGLGLGQLQLYDRNGNLVKVLADGLSLPRGVDVSPKQLIYVCDEHERCVYILTANGSIVKLVKYSWSGQFLFDGPRFVCATKDGSFLVSDAGMSVKKVDGNGQVKWTYRSGLVKSELWDITVDCVGMVLVADWVHGIHVLNPEGIFQGLMKQPTDIVIKEPTSVRVCNDTNQLLVGTSNGDIYGVTCR